MLTPIQVVGIGLDGAAGLSVSVRAIVDQANLLVGSDRHLDHFPDHPAEKWALTSFKALIDQLRDRLSQSDLETIVVLASGDPLFFGVGRLLVEELPPECLTFHPHTSAIQLAFSRIKMPWQDAQLVSSHGRSLDRLTQVLKQGAAKIVVLTDGTNSPNEIAKLLLELDLPGHHQIWVCENLGSPDERVQSFTPEALLDQTFAPLNVVVLLWRPAIELESLEPNNLPAFGLPDSLFLSFPDRPGLITKREVRLLILGELDLRPAQTVWDIGAGTGSVSIEIGRLYPQSQIFAIEKTAIGASLIRQNCQRFRVTTITAIHNKAPEALVDLPSPDRIFIGGSGGQLQPILDMCGARLKPGGILVLAIGALEHLNAVWSWLERQTLEPNPTHWSHRLLQVQLSRSVSVASLTRFSPLNPVTLVGLGKE